MEAMDIDAGSARRGTKRKGRETRHEDVTGALLSSGSFSVSSGSLSGSASPKRARALAYSQDGSDSETELRVVDPEAFVEESASLVSEESARADVDDSAISERTQLYEATESPASSSSRRPSIQSPSSVSNHSPVKVLLT